MTANQNSLPAISETTFIDAYLDLPWNPFESEIPDKETFPSNLVFQAHWPIGLFICALLSSEQASPIPPHIRQGLPDLAEFHFGTTRATPRKNCRGRAPTFGANGFTRSRARTSHPFGRGIYRARWGAPLDGLSRSNSRAAPVCSARGGACHRFTCRANCQTARFSK